MKKTKYILCLLLILLTVSPLFAQNRDTIYTSYANGKFTTKCIVHATASREVMNAVVDDYLYQVKFNLDALFTWALKGLKLRKESDELFIMNFKSTTYDAKEDLVKAIGDVEVPGVISFPEIHVNSKWTKVQMPDKINMLIDVKYSDAFLKKTDGLFSTVANKTNTVSELTLVTNVEFGWFFNIFVTKSMFKKIMEWRFATMMKNIKTEAECRNAKQLILKRNR